MLGRHSGWGSEIGEDFMEQIDAGAYLTERLRASQPEPFERELERRRRASQRTGFFLGFALAVAGCAISVIAVIVFAPQAAEGLIASLG
jgi:hypothetical protein